MNLRELWSAYRTHDWKVNINHLEKKRILDEEMITQHSGLIISADDQYLASSQPYIKIRVKTQKGSYGEPEEFVEVEKDIIITSTKQEVNTLKQEALQKERELEEAKNKKAFEVRNKIKEIGKRKDPAEIHIVKSSNLAIDKIDVSNMTTRLNSDFESESLLSPLRVEGDLNKSDSRYSETRSNRVSRIFPNSYNEDYFKYTTAKERARDMHLMRAEIEEKKREEIVKIREINKLMKSMGNEEHENNIKLFQKYNEDEKQIVNALIKKAKEKDINEKITKRLQIIKDSRRKDIIKSEMNFAMNFSRQKNLIEKYEQAGEKSKRVRKEKIEMLGRVKTLKTYKSDKPKVQLSSQLFDTSFVEEKPSKDMSSLHYQATMDTNRTEILTNSIRKVSNARDPLRNMNIQKSYNSYRVPSQDMRNFSIRHSITNDEENQSSDGTLHPTLPKHYPISVRSMSGIKIANGRSVDTTIPNHKGMFALPSIHNNDALQLLHNYHTPNKYNFL